MNYEQALSKKEKLQRKVDEYSVVLNSFESDTYGLISEDIRNSNDYKLAKMQYDKSFKELREFNSWFIRNYKKEYLQDKKNKR